MFGNEIKKPCSELDPNEQYHCWFMFDNHTFAGIKGNLFEVYKKIRKLFSEDNWGGWGHLMLLKDYDPKSNNNKSKEFVSGLQVDLDYFECLDPGCSGFAQKKKDEFYASLEKKPLVQSCINCNYHFNGKNNEECPLVQMGLSVGACPPEGFYCNKWSKECK